jgi:hypothetical protein
VQGADAKLLPHFITWQHRAGAFKVRAGNERVRRVCPTPPSSSARIASSRWRRASRARRRDIQAKLGSIGDKVRRVVTLAGEIALLSTRIAPGGTCCAA